MWGTPAVPAGTARVQDDHPKADLLEALFRLLIAREKADTCAGHPRWAE